MSCNKKNITITKSEYYNLKKIQKKLITYSEGDSVQLNVRNLLYACGDCYPSYLIQKVLYVEYANDKKQVLYYNKEIYVIFSEDLKKQLGKLGKINCSGICYEYVLYGFLQTNGYGTMKLEALGGEITLNKECCENR